MASSDNNTASSGASALLISPAGNIVAELLPLLSHNMPGVQIHPLKEYPEADALADAMHRHRPRLCFLDVQTRKERALQVIRDLQLIDSAIQIVVLLGPNDQEKILECLRAGAAEFLIQPFTVEDLKPVLMRVSQRSPLIHFGKGGRIICVAPSKGACGASTLAANLAYRRKSLGADHVLLADLDPLTGTISFLLKLKSAYSFLDAMSLAANLDGDLWKGVVSSVDGLDVILAPENPMDTLNDMQEPSVILEFARQLYETIIVDTAGLFGEWGLSLARIADELLLVTTNELPALQATQRVLAHLDRNRIERSKVRLVVNRYSRDVGLSKDAISAALHTDVFQIIPSDYESVQRALVEGKPINGSSAFGKSLTDLAERLRGEKELADAEASAGKKPKPKSSSLGGLFGSIFSRSKAGGHDSKKHRS
jgi:pilus assembly protein CpaE